MIGNKDIMYRRKDMMIWIISKNDVPEDIYMDIMPYADQEASL